MSDVTIDFEGVSKKFRISSGGLSDVVHSLRRKLRGWIRGEDLTREIDPEREIWALKDVSFQVRRGEVLGIIGPNGAGKSTILKIISRITRASSGLVRVSGKVGALIEVGAGFHDELTGRENIYMNGVIMGMSQKEIDDKYDQIVEFAGLKEFINTPLKKYSSGMRVRLGFSVAAHLEPEVLLIDEVLSVGDINFQSKSAQKILSFKEKDISIIFVSHNMSSISAICDKVLFLEHGQVQEIGSPNEVIERYLKSCDRGDKEFASKIDLDGDESNVFTIEKVILVNQEGVETQEFSYRDDLTVRIYYRVRERIDIHVDLNIREKSRSLIAASMMLEGNSITVEGSGYLDCTFKSIALFPGNYEVHGFVRDKTGVGILCFSRLLAVFEVNSSIDEYGFKGDLALPFIKWYGAGTTVQPYEWKVNRLNNEGDAE